MQKKEKLNFVECLQLIDHLIREKILFQDPDNKNNVLIYREKGETSPEGWYSENIHTAARELADDEKSQLFLLEAYIEKTGKEIAFENWLDKKPTSVSIVIEDYDGNPKMAFVLSFKDGNFDVQQTKNCSHTDTDGDYIFDTDNDLIRIQSEKAACWQIRSVDDDLATAECSNCGWIGLFEEGCFYKYCPECGAYMNVENNDCPNGGDITDDCKDCVYSGEYHYCNGECVKR